MKVHRKHSLDRVRQKAGFAKEVHVSIIFQSQLFRSVLECIEITRGFPPLMVQIGSLVDAKSLLKSGSRVRRNQLQSRLAAVTNQGASAKFEVRFESLRGSQPPLGRKLKSEF